MLRNYDPRQSASAMFSEAFVRCQSADPIIPSDLRPQADCGASAVRTPLNWIHPDLFLGVEQRTVGCRVTSNHNKVAVYGLVSQPITAYVGHLCWPLLVASLSVASSDPVLSCVSDAVESDLIFVGLIVFENKLKPETTPVIRELHDANIRTVMVTGMLFVTQLGIMRTVVVYNR